MSKSSSDILTVEEVAELLKIPRSSVYKLAQEGKIPGKKVGRHWRFHRGVLLCYVAGLSTLDNVTQTSELLSSVGTEKFTD